MYVIQKILKITIISFSENKISLKSFQTFYIITFLISFPHIITLLIAFTPNKKNKNYNKNNRNIISQKSSPFLIFKNIKKKKNFSQVF